MRITLNELIGEHCQSVDQGQKLYRLIFPIIKEREGVEIDFAQVQSVLTPFLNAAFGKLFDFFHKDQLISLLSFRNISPEHLKKVNEYLDYVDRMDSDKLARETLEDMYEEDRLRDDGLM